MIQRECSGLVIFLDPGTEQGLQNWVYSFTPFANHMHSSSKHLLEFISRLTYNVDGLPGRLKLSLSQFLTFHFSKEMSVSQIQDIENRKAFKPCTSKEEIEEAAAYLSLDEKIWALAAVQWLQIQAEEADDRTLARRIAGVWQNTATALNLQSEVDKIESKRLDIEGEIQKERSRPVIKIAGRIWPLTLDYFLRWGLLLSFSYWNWDKTPLISFNVLFVPVLVLIIAWWVGKRNRRSNKQLLESLGGSSVYRIEYSYSTEQYTWLALFFCTSIFIGYLMPTQLHVVALFGLSLYYFVYLRFFRVGRLNENDLARQLERSGARNQSLSVDENDEAIVALETKLNSSTSRLEAYVLESALFGALSFSGFLQIMATDLVTFKDLEDFASFIFITTQSFIHFDWNQLASGLQGLNSKKSLFCLVSVESLVCSIFFLAVIASRLRFSNIADKVRTAINLAKAYNAKEEAFYEEHGEEKVKSKRLESLTTKVNEQVIRATAVLEEINPVMKYMQYFRNGGILVFLVILISSSLFITGLLSWAFVLLVLATTVYFNKTAINEQFKAFFLNFRIQFVKQGYWLMALALLPYFLGYVLRIFFQVEGTRVLIAAGHLFTALYIFLWLILAAHVDEQFGEIESPENQRRLSRWKIVKNALATAILVFGIGRGFKELHLTGADEMLMTGLFAIAGLMYFVGYYLTKIRWVGILMGGVIATVTVGILFKTLHLRGANLMILVANVAFALSLPALPVIYWKRKLFHQLLLRFYLVVLLIATWYNPFFDRVPLTLELAYIHETTQTREILDVFDEVNTEEILSNGKDAISRSVESSNWYIDRYGESNGFTIVYRHMILNYHDVANEILDSEKLAKDTAMLEVALMAARQQQKIFKLFSYDAPGAFYEPRPVRVPIEMEAAVLVAMGRPEEAVRSLENILASNPPEEVAQLVRNRLDQIRGLRN